MPNDPIPEECRTCGANHALNPNDVDCSVDVCPHGIDRVKEGIFSGV